ncbi:uncharacterized protein LOC119324429 isoform X2 [Triticum dicoccoides]|uniref:uncharacterized protein LOC119324429 isoform X2 n=1 Tax=Triticum dicoccoides TaxID=85692 RepID=UPI0018911D0E|nr:uncharacterized protein LOC119324429 isoform X2 [Triticum dicoccoides]
MLSPANVVRYTRRVAGPGFSFTSRCQGQPRHCRAFGPEPVVDLNNSTVAISGHDDESVGAISTPPHVHDTSPKSSLDSGHVPIVGTAEYTLMAAIPEVVTELATFPGVPFTTKAQEVFEVLHDTSSACIKFAPITCSTECSQQVATTDFGNKGRDAPTAIFLEHAVDLKDITPNPPMAEPEDQKEYQAVDITIDVKLATPVPPMLSRYNPGIANNYADVADASLILWVTRPAQSVPSVALVHGDDRVQPTACTEHRPHGVHLVVESKGSLLPPLRKETEPQPWPPPIQVQIAGNNDIQVLGIATTDDVGYVWWPPDYQPRLWSELQKWLLSILR